MNDNNGFILNELMVGEVSREKGRNGYQEEEIIPERWNGSYSGYEYAAHEENRSTNQKNNCHDISGEFRKTRQVESPGFEEKYIVSHEEERGYYQTDMKNKG